MGLVGTKFGLNPMTLGGGRKSASSPRGTSNSKASHIPHQVIERTVIEHEHHDGLDLLHVLHRKDLVGKPPMRNSISCRLAGKVARNVPNRSRRLERLSGHGWAFG